MKIVHLLPSLNKGGTERIVLSLASIQQKKHSVSIIVFSDSNLYSNLSKGLDIIYITENTFIEYSLFGIKNKSTSELEKILSKLAPQIIHSHSFWTDLLLLSIPYINATYVSHFHLHYPDLNSKVNGLSKKSITRYIDTRRMIRKYNKYGFNFITVSKDIDAYYKKRIPKKMWSRIHYIPNSINLEEFRPQKGFDQPSMTNKSKYTLISVSRLIALKNHTFLIYVVKKLITDNQLPVKLIICGEGPERTNLESLIEKEKLQNYIQLKGNVDDLAKELFSADLYVHASKIESFGLSLVEAMACGLPCVSINAGGNQDFIQNEVNGYLLEEDVDKFSEIIVRLLTQPKLYHEISLKGLETAQKYDISTYELKIETVYGKRIRN